MKKRVYYTYDFRVGNMIVHRGITRDPKRSEQEHKQRWENGHLVIVGRARTEESARKWQAAQHEDYRSDTSPAPLPLLRVHARAPSSSA